MINVRSRKPRLWKRWLIVALWMALIFLMSAQSNSGEQSNWVTQLIFQMLGQRPDPETATQIHHLLRKGAHFTEYGVLAVLIAWAQPGLARERAAFTWGLATLYAATDEVHQSFVPNRGPAFGDVLIDSAGALTGLVFWLLWRRR